MKNALLAMPLLVAGVALTAAAAVSPSASASTAGTNATGTSTAALSASACKPANLKVSVGGGAGAGMNQYRTGLQLRNAGRSTCALHGYPRLEWVAGASDRRVGPWAGRTSDPAGGPEKTVTLAPGALASAPLDFVNPAIYPSCKPTPVRGLRVYPPGERNAVFLPSRGTTCASKRMMWIGYLQRGVQPASKR